MDGDEHRPGDDPAAAASGDATGAKRALRTAARAHRAETPDDVRSVLAASWTDRVLALDALADARVVAAYTSYGTEPPTAHLVDALRARGVRVLLPVLLDDKDLDWIDARDTARTEPVRLGLDAIAAADVVIVPALLVARDGTRLGQGGGSYDRALRRIAAGTPVVALTHDDELVAAGALPHDEHDIPVTHVVTPSRTHTVD